MLRFIILAAGLLYCGTASAAFKTGNSLMQVCREDNQFSNGYCLGVIAGITDGLEFSQSSLRARPVICVPPTATVGQISGVVLKYLRDNPGTLHYAAADLAYLALLQAFPCQP